MKVGTSEIIKEMLDQEEEREFGLKNEKPENILQQEEAE